VRLKTGEILHADVIIGADGRRSIVRRVVDGEDEEPEATPNGLSVYAGSVSMTKIRKYPPLKQLMDVGWSIWFGDGRVVLGTCQAQQGSFLLLMDSSGNLAIPVVSLDAV
jgi:salicylate hydroxylase